jgi:hypothetical protein
MMFRTQFRVFILAIIFVFAFFGKCDGQINAIIKNRLYPSGNIDTIFVLKPRTYVCLKNNEDQYIAIPDINAPLQDTIKRSLSTYFSTSYTNIQGTKPKPKTKKVVAFSTIEPTLTVQDSIFHFLYELHNTNFSEVTVPDTLFDLMKANHLDHMMLVFQYGFIKADKVWKKEEIVAVTLSLLTGFNITSSQYHNEITCCILDLETRKIAYYGYIICEENPTDPNGYIRSFHWLFDGYLSNKKLIGKP